VLRLEAVYLEGLIEWCGLADNGQTKGTRVTKLLVAARCNETTCHKGGGCVNPSFGDVSDWLAPGERIRGVFGLRSVSARIHDICRVEERLTAQRFTRDARQKGER
jgi:hypothetical protein